MHDGWRRFQMLKVVHIRDQVIMEVEDFEAPEL